MTYLNTLDSLSNCWLTARARARARAAGSYRYRTCSVLVFLSRTSASMAAALRSLLKKRFVAYNGSMTMMQRTLSSQAVFDSSPFVQRIRDLPKDLPGNNIKKEVSQVISLSLSLSLSRFCRISMLYVASSCRTLASFLHLFFFFLDLFVLV